MNIQEKLQLNPQTGDVGVEIEVEANNLPPREAVSVHWRKERDASLRGESAEFVLQSPVPIKLLDRAFKELDNALKSYGTVVRPTYRAGIHVHVNVQQLTPTQLVTFISAYFLLEEVLLRFCDKTRLGNHFCLRMSDASYSLDALVSFIQEQNLQVLNTEDLRYASLNVTSLFKYGSLEFRALESTLDFERIKIWAGVLTHLRDYATTLKDPTELLGQASEMGFEKFAPIILGKWYPHFSKWATEENLKRGVRNIQMAIYSRDWAEEDLNIFKKENLF